MRLILALFLAIGFLGCKSDTRKKAEELADLLSVDGANYKVAKAKTRINGFTVLKNKTTGEFVAFNLDLFDPDTMTSADSYLDSLGADDQYRNLDMEIEYVYTHVYVGQGEYTWQWVPHTVYTNGTLVFEHQVQMLKDLEKMGAVLEQSSLQNLSNYVAAEYGLSTERAFEVARSLQSFGELSRYRRLTDDDYAELTKTILGSSVEELKRASEMASAGKSDDFDRLIDEAARLNATSPEQIRSILGSF